MSQAALSQGRPMSWTAVSLLILGSLMAVVFIAGFAVPYLVFDSAALARFEGRTFWIWTHVAAGTVALLTGPVLIWLGLKRKRLDLHRPLGFVYLAAGTLGSLAAFYLAARLVREVSYGIERYRNVEGVEEGDLPG